MLHLIDRVRVFGVLLIAGFCLITFCDYGLIHIDPHAQGWHQEKLIPTEGPPVGVDFHYTYTRARRLFSDGTSPYLATDWYPPFTYLLYGMVAWLPYPAAYFLFVVVMTLAAIISVLVPVRLVDLFPTGGEGIRRLGWVTGALAAMQLVSGYAFLLGIERGSNEPLVYLLCWLALWLVTFHPRERWWPVVLLSVATQIKVYPAIFFLLVARQHGWRIVGLAFLINLAALFLTGWDNAVAFLSGLWHGTFAGRQLWVGNHSAFSFAQFLLGDQHPLLNHLKLTVVALPLLLFLASVGRLWRRPPTPLGLWLLALAALPLTLTLPAISHDFKLVALAPVVVSLAVWFGHWHLTGRHGGLVGASVLLLLLGFLQLSPLLIDLNTPWKYLANKYPFILCLQLLISWVIHRFLDKKHGASLSRS